MAPFYPVFNSNGKLVIDSSTKLGPIDKTNVVSVLCYYKIPVEINSKKEILIPEDTNSDLEFLWNVTTKSTDTLWLKEHIW